MLSIRVKPCLNAGVLMILQWCDARGAAVDFAQLVVWPSAPAALERDNTWAITEQQTAPLDMKEPQWGQSKALTAGGHYSERLPSVDPHSTEDSSAQINMRTEQCYWCYPSIKNAVRIQHEPNQTKTSEYKKFK